ncbi:hypothetical protein HZA55_01440 [Candidatus Poribacteria bacterium]|nr:hypothetical protein [Candidatus Poribacteria bacterium]
MNDLPDYITPVSQILALPEAIPTGKKSSTTILDIEKEHIEKILHELNGNKLQAALKLGISRTSLWRKIKQYKLDSSRSLH